MANVKKCDICGKVYENKCPEKTIELYIYDKKTVTSNEFGFGGSNSIDCCPNCTDRILNFVNAMKNSK